MAMLGMREDNTFLRPTGKPLAAFFCKGGPQMARLSKKCPQDSRTVLFLEHPSRCVAREATICVLSSIPSFDATPKPLAEKGGKRPTWSKNLLSASLNKGPFNFQATAYKSTNLATNPAFLKQVCQKWDLDLQNGLLLSLLHAITKEVRKGDSSKHGNFSMGTV